MLNLMGVVRTGTLGVHPVCAAQRVEFSFKSKVMRDVFVPLFFLYNVSTEQYSVVCDFCAAVSSADLCSCIS